MIDMYEQFFREKNSNCFYWKYIKELKEKSIEQWTTEKLNMFQLDAIRYLFDYVMKKVPYYQEKYKDFRNMKIETLEDFSRLPMISKEELRDNNKEFWSGNELDLSQVHISTGTTGGKPIFTYYTKEELFFSDLLPQYTELMPGSEADRILIALPYEMSSSGQAFQRVFQIQRGSCVLPAGKGGFYSTVSKTLEFIYEMNPTCIVTTPSYAVYLAENAYEHGVDLKESSNIRYMILTGEGCSDALRKRIENLWKTKAKFFYGSLEAGQIGIECDNQKYYHVTGANCLVEIIDELTGLPVKDGEIGEIVITPLLRWGMPLIRYCTKDRGQFIQEECCDNHLPLLKVYGRKQEQLYDRFSSFMIEELIMNFEEVGNWYQLIEEKETLIVNVEPSDLVYDTVSAAKKIRDRLERILQVKCHVTFVEKNSLPRPTGKLIRVKKGEHK